ncbi:phytanoyl-CoA dioxygenase family protein [Streptomyces syringium]|uniref:phytanoyl-CoA dioxygenase family protein n=1 Tax=Streptomyces syringium TaxID=76729 RepID=UPI0033F087DF
MSAHIALTEGDRHDFVRDGVLIRRRFVQGARLQQAAALVQDWYRTGFQPQEMRAYTNRTFAPELADHPDLLDLYQGSGLAEVVGQLLHPALPAPVNTVQVQIRVPDAAEQPAKEMHVDGVACPHLDAAELRTFTLIAGVMLSGLPDAAAGALHYLPAGHWRMAEWFSGDWSPGDRAQTPPGIASQPGTPFLAEPGDVIVMHHLVPHRVGANSSPVPRTMAYFRIRHSTHGEHAVEALRDPWLEYPGLRAIAARHSRAAF